MTMTDSNSNTPAGEHDPCIEIQIDYDDYGLHEQESATTIIRIDHDTSVFERIGKIESEPTGVVLKEHTRLTDDVANDMTEAYTPIQFISAHTDEFETRLRKAIFDFAYAGKVPEELGEQLAETLTEDFSQHYNEFSPYS
jgi:hypothetical protein